MNNEWIELKGYYIILKTDHVIFGIDYKYYLDYFGAIVFGDIVVFSSGNERRYLNACEWLKKSFYWNYNNSFFSHNQFNESCDWLKLLQDKVKFLI